MLKNKPDRAGLARLITTAATIVVVVVFIRRFAS
jgi:hypothetical protein